MIGRSLPFLSLAWIWIEDEPDSLKVIVSLSPRSRLMPLNEESSANLSSWSRRSLNCLARLSRMTLPLISCWVG